MICKWKHPIIKNINDNIKITVSSQIYKIKRK